VAKVASSEWIEWAGGKCTLGFVAVEARYRDGQTAFGDSCDFDPASWMHEAGKFDIVAYRVSPVVAEQASSDWVEWTGGVCPVPTDAVVDIRTTRGTYENIPAAKIALGRWERSFLPGGNIDAYRVVSA
jgi:hypothetical protein